MVNTSERVGGALGLAIVAMIANSKTKSELHSGLRASTLLSLGNQDARSATHELQLTLLAENWTP